MNCERLWGTVPQARPWVAQHRKAAEALCEDTENWPYMQVWVDDAFKHNYLRVYRSDGWVEKAWLATVKAVPSNGGKTWNALTQRLVSSLHRFSSQPVIVVNFGEVRLPDLDPKRFTNLVVLNARSVEERGLPFSFNKIQAALLARVKVGVMLDADMVSLGPQADSLFTRAEQEIDKKYPYPILPVHSLDRDPENLDGGLPNFKPFSCQNCPQATMRWGAEQPSWTYWSLPFLARWQAAKLAGKRLQGISMSDVDSSEELLNVALWTANATKEWCAWQPAGSNIVWKNFFSQHPPRYPYHEDPKRYPFGTPVAYFFAHAGNHVQDIDRTLKILEEQKRDNRKWPSAFYHNMNFFGSFAELKAQYPDIPCIM
eukprot:SRR837773.24023.p1 GENE.SRR837773.24023~~SRR837773.24023.p1  ORF type:complete len:427 (-),score=149.35 SRR837773.24023:110-1222(-)